MSDQDSREAASAPSCWSVADPEKEIVFPTLQVVPVAGASIVATGGVLVGDSVLRTLTTRGWSRMSDVP
jgi:hypothetical protein